MWFHVIFIEILLGECINHGILVFTSLVSLAFVILDDAFDASACLGMVSGVDKCESAPVACKLDARQ